MKKKHRDIVVDGVQYAWTLYGRGKEHDITVWKDKKRFFTTTVRVTEITPSLIKELIQDHNKAGDE